MSELLRGRTSDIEVIQPPQGIEPSGLTVVLFHGYPQTDVGIKNPDHITPTEAIAGLAESYALIGATVYVPHTDMHFPFWGGGLSNPLDMDLSKDVVTARTATEDILAHEGTGKKELILAGFSGGGNLAHRVGSRIETRHPNTVNAIHTVGSVMLFETTPPGGIDTVSVVSSGDSVLAGFQKKYETNPLFGFGARTLYGSKDIRTNRHYELRVVAAGDHMDTPGHPAVRQQVIDLAGRAHLRRRSAGPQSVPAA